MKKIIYMILALALCLTCVFSFIGCKNDTGNIITVGYTLYEPMNYLDASGNLIGFDTELAKAVFEELGYRVIFKKIEWESKYIDLNSGNIDCIWNGFTSNSEDDGVPRSDSVDFSYNYMRNSQTVVVKTTDVASYTDKATSFSGKVGAFEQGSAAVDYVGTFTGVSEKPMDSQMSAILEVVSGSSNFAVVDLLLAARIAGSGDFASLSYLEAFNSDTEYYAIGFAKGSELTAKVNAVLEQFAENGKLLEIATKYNLDDVLIDDYTSQK